ncbi:hypothetical protein COCMIDRAFT_97557, partial [Bipolaris oryzae ATCC 44560]
LLSLMLFPLSPLFAPHSSFLFSFWISEFGFFCSLSLSRVAWRIHGKRSCIFLVLLLLFQRASFLMAYLFFSSQAEQDLVGLGGFPFTPFFLKYHTSFLSYLYSKGDGHGQGVGLLVVDT